LFTQLVADRRLSADELQRMRDLLAQATATDESGAQ
jgi:hypothetical protein